MNHTMISEGLRIFHYSMCKKMLGIPSYKGNSEQICQEIIKRCWTGSYFMTSSGHFCQFYTRDFAWCTRPLIRLGHKESVHKTLGYALSRFSKKKKVTVAISPGGNAFDFPTYAVDSLPYLIYSLVESNEEELAEQYRTFLEKELERFVSLVVDKKTGLVKQGHFSSAKDHSIRQSSCYDTTMVALLSSNLDKLGLNNPLKRYDYKKLIIKNYWNGHAFMDDMSKNAVISGDANVFPFWCGTINDKERLTSSINTLKTIGLDKPLPLKYTSSRQNTISMDVLTPNFQGDTIWTYLGLLFINNVSKVDPRMALYYLVKYGRLIEEQGNLLEVLDPQGRPYSSAFYLTDDSMLWASIYLELVQRLK
ncbi:MAG: hypothetical protein V1837_02150 [Candidatus Woesearchaeota archaeon]